MSLQQIIGILSGAFLATGAWAADINTLQSLAQSEFKNFAKDLTGALSYKGVAPAVPLGVTGFDVGLSLSGTQMKHSSLWQKASGYDLSVLPVPKLHVSKGLPFGIDIGGFYTSVPTTNIKLWGAELKYAVLEGSALTPAVAVRGAYTKLDGVSQLSFDTQSLELLISKGFVGVTPYGGVGVVRSKASATLPAPFTLSSESNTATKAFVGLNWNILLGNLAVEYDRTGSNDTLSAKVGIRW
ncbi:MAG: hypothetical protein HZB71_03935 [Betaproteobacteria bacterium]|nr:hypothetical protein [Betaproteobacteria bacterium]